MFKNANKNAKRNNLLKSGAYALILLSLSLIMNVAFKNIDLTNTSLLTLKSVANGCYIVASIVCLGCSIDNFIKVFETKKETPSFKKLENEPSHEVSLSDKINTNTPSIDKNLDTQNLSKIEELRQLRDELGQSGQLSESDDTEKTIIKKI